MRIVIVGGGAIGRLFGSYLVRGDNEITLIDRDEATLGDLRERGIGLIEGDADLLDGSPSYSVGAFSSARSIGEADLVLLLVKSQATVAAVKDVQHLVSENCPLLSVQGGLGNLEIACQYLPEEHILGGCSFLSGMALSGGRVRKGGYARLHIGELDGSYSMRLDSIAQNFNQCGLETHISERIMGLLWGQVIVHSAINPVTALLQVPNGVLISRMESITLMKRLIDEGLAVARSCSIELGQDDLYDQLFAACEGSANNLSPMLQDILNEFPTEVDAQNGAICRYAEENTIRVPTHMTMVELVKLLESWKSGGDR